MLWKNCRKTPPKETECVLKNFGRKENYLLYFPASFFEHIAGTPGKNQGRRLAISAVPNVFTNITHNQTRVKPGSKTFKSNVNPNLVRLFPPVLSPVQVAPMTIQAARE